MILRNCKICFFTTKFAFLKVFFNFFKFVITQEKKLQFQYKSRVTMVMSLTAEAYGLNESSRSLK